jgi:hypothetical protein
MANTTLIIGLLAVALIVSAMGTLTAVTKFSTGLVTQGTTTADVEATADITLSPTTVSFGDVDIGVPEDTTDNDPQAFGITNDGSVNVNVTIVSTQLWDTQTNTSLYYKAKCRTGQVACGAGSEESWISIPVGAAAIKVIGTLPFANGGDQNLVDIYIEAPTKEPAAPVEATITFSATAT